MDKVKGVIIRLMAATAIAACAALALRAVSPGAGAAIAETIGLGIALTACAVLILALRIANEAFPMTAGAPAEAAQNRLMACGLTSYMVCLSVALGLMLAGVLPWIAVVVYASPLAVSMVVALATNRAANAQKAP